MSRPLFGQLLSQLVSLSDHDIAEILEDQSISHRRFGEIAMAFQLCSPQDVWQAWWAQLGSRTEHITLSVVGVDTQALSCMPRVIAEQYPVIPVRAYGDQVVLAATEESRARASFELPKKLQMQIHFVLAPETQIREAIGRYYIQKAG